MWADAGPPACTTQRSQTGLILWLEARVHLQCHWGLRVCHSIPPPGSLRTHFLIQLETQGHPAKADLCPTGILLRVALDFLIKLCGTCLASLRLLPSWMEDNQKWLPQICLSHLTQPAPCSPTGCLLSAGGLPLGEPRWGSTVTALSPLPRGYLPSHRAVFTHLCVPRTCNVASAQRMFA